MVQDIMLYFSANIIGSKKTLRTLDTRLKEHKRGVEWPTGTMASQKSTASIGTVLECYTSNGTAEKSCRYPAPSQT